MASTSSLMASATFLDDSAAPTVFSASFDSSPTISGTPNLLEFAIIESKTCSFCGKATTKFNCSECVKNKLNLDVKCQQLRILLMERDTLLASVLNSYEKQGFEPVQEFATDLETTRSSVHLLRVQRTLLRHQLIRKRRQLAQDKKNSSRLFRIQQKLASSTQQLAKGIEEHKSRVVRLRQKRDRVFASVSKLEWRLTRDLIRCLFPSILKRENEDEEGITAAVSSSKTLLEEAAATIHPTCLQPLNNCKFDPPNQKSTAQGFTTAFESLFSGCFGHRIQFLSIFSKIFGLHLPYYTDSLNSYYILPRSSHEEETLIFKINYNLAYVFLAIFMSHPSFEEDQQDHDQISADHLIRNIDLTGDQTTHERPLSTQAFGLPQYLLNEMLDARDRIKWTAGQEVTDVAFKVEDWVQIENDFSNMAIEENSPNLKSAILSAATGLFLRPDL